MRSWSFEAWPYHEWQNWKWWSGHGAASSVAPDSLFMTFLVRISSRNQALSLVKNTILSLWLVRERDHFWRSLTDPAPVQVMAASWIPESSLVVWYLLPSLSSSELHHGRVSDSALVLITAPSLEPWSCSTDCSMGLQHGTAQFFLVFTPEASIVMFYEGEHQRLHL